MMRFGFISLVSLTLAGCVSAPAPVRGPGVPQTPPARAPQATMPVAGSFVPDSEFSICPIRVRNAPTSDREGRFVNYSRLFVLDGRHVLATIPVNGACLSSGFGIRDGRLHKGLDISAVRGTWIYSAAPGIVREADWGGALGNYILIEHGPGVFTRYAHLDAFVEGVDVGTELGFGWPIGQVGNSSTQRIGVHLHYEVLTGDYDTPRRSFGLTAHDPFSFPAYIEQAVR